MKRTKIAPTLAGLAAARWNFMDTPGSAGFVGGEYARAESAAWNAATAELRALLAVVRAAASDPDPHHRVEAALARLRRLSAPERGVSPRGSTVKGKSKLPGNSRGATRKGGGRS